MSRSIQLPYQFMWSKSHPHIAWADLYNNGLLTEIAVIAMDENNGDLYFIPIAALDNVDKDRMVKVITKRDSHKYPLWDLLSGSTLKNGMNALEYFNQLVKVRSLSGQIFVPQSGKMGAGSTSLSVRPTIQAPMPAPQALADAVAHASYPETATAQAPARRGPGRPPSAK